MIHPVACEQIYIVLAEDDGLLSSFIEEIIRGEPDLRLVQSVRTGPECLNVLDEETPDVLLLDVNLPGLSGFEVLDRLGERTDQIRVLVLSASEDTETQMEAARLGARGFLPKSQARRVLTRVIRDVAAGSTCFQPEVSSRLISEHQQLIRKRREQDRPMNQLSDRERQVLELVAQGMTNSQIAAELFMSVHTVKLHVANILRKFNLPNRTEAAVFAVREGLAPGARDLRSRSS